MPNNQQAISQQQNNAQYQIISNQYHSIKNAASLPRYDPLKKF